MKQVSVLRRKKKKKKKKKKKTFYVGRTVLRNIMSTDVVVRVLILKICLLIVPGSNFNQFITTIQFEGFCHVPVSLP